MTRNTESSDSPENHHMDDTADLFEPMNDTSQGMAADTSAYTEDDIITLDPKEHIRRRPGMYIGKLGDGSNSDDGIYVLLKESLVKEL